MQCAGERLAMCEKLSSGHFALATTAIESHPRVSSPTTLRYQPCSNKWYASYMWMCFAFAIFGMESWLAFEFYCSLGRSLAVFAFYCRITIIRLSSTTPLTARSITIFTSVRHRPTAHWFTEKHFAAKIKGFSTLGQRTSQCDKICDRFRLPVLVA